MTDALAETFASRGLHALAFNGGWCAPLMDFGTTNPNKRPECRAEIGAAYDRILADPAITHVLLVGQWPNYTLGYRFGDSRLAAYTFSDAHNTDIARNPEYVATALDLTLARLLQAGKTVAVMSTVPEYLYDVPAGLARRLMFGAPTTGPGSGLDLPVADYRLRNAAMTPILDEMTARHEVPLIDAAAPFCDAMACRSHGPDGMPYYEDSNHLNLIGARRLVPGILDALELWHTAAR